MSSTNVKHRLCVVGLWVLTFPDCLSFIIDHFSSQLYTSKPAVVWNHHRWFNHPRCGTEFCPSYHIKQSDSLRRIWSVLSRLIYLVSIFVCLLTSKTLSLHSQRLYFIASQISSSLSTLYLWIKCWYLAVPSQCRTVAQWPVAHGMLSKLNGQMKFILFSQW